MKSLVLVVLLAAAATAAVVSNVPDVADGDEVADVDLKDMPEVIVIDVVEPTDMAQEPQTAVTSRRSLSLGTIGNRDIRVVDMQIRAEGFAVRDVIINTNRLITAIRVDPWGPSNTAGISIVSGGLRRCCVTIRMSMIGGLGYIYRIQVYVS